VRGSSGGRVVAPRKKGGEGSNLALKETPKDGKEEGGSLKTASNKIYMVAVKWSTKVAR
jgi:hypothetical protein